MERENSRTSTAGESRSFTYGKQDRLQTMTDATGTTTYEYDAAGRFSGIVYPHGGSVRYVRDALGRTVEQSVRATASAPPLVTAYAYDAVGNLSEVTDPQGGKTTFEYDAENRLSSRTLPNNVVTTYTYDARDRPLSVVHKNAANLVLASRTYVRAPGGEPTRITKEDGSYVEVGYDSALRITSERYYTSAGDLDDELGYTYDADGNRLTKTVNGVTSTYAYASGARLTGITTAGVSEGRTTDNGGRETALALMSHQLALTYDSDDHVTRVVNGASATDFTFDAAGRRVSVTSGGATKRFLTAPNAGDGYESPQAITDASGALIASYVFAGETPIAKSTPSGTQYYLTDALGSVIATSGETGILASTLDYDAFGNERSSGALAGDTHGDFRLHGMWKDPSGLYYVRARVYDAETGRFTSRDPISIAFRRPESLLAYAFASHAPTMLVDPTGMYSLGETSAAVLGSSILSSVATAFTQGALTGRVNTSDVVLAGVVGAFGGAGLVAAATTVPKLVLLGAELSAVQSWLGQEINGQSHSAESLLWAALAGGASGWLGSAFQIPAPPRLSWSNSSIFADPWILEAAKTQSRLHALEISLAVTTSVRNILAVLIAGAPDYQIERGIAPDPS